MSLGIIAGGTVGAPLKPLRDDSALRALDSEGLKGGTYAERHQSLRQQMLELGCENATVGKNGLRTSLLGSLDPGPISRPSTEDHLSLRLVIWL